MDHATGRLPDVVPFDASFIHEPVTRCGTLDVPLRPVVEEESEEKDKTNQFRIVNVEMIEYGG